MIKTSLVIVGGGFGGVACARECARLFKRRPDVDIILVSPRPYHDYHGALYEMATAVNRSPRDNFFEGPRIKQTYTPQPSKIARGSLRKIRNEVNYGQDKDVQVCLRKAVCLPLTDIFRGTRVKLIHGTVTSIDRKQRQIRIPHASVLSYSYAVLALGSAPAYHGISGIREHASVLKTIDDAIFLRRAIIDAWKRVCRNAARRTQGIAAPLKIIIGGGGFTGVEFAAELAGMLEILASSHQGMARVPYEIVLLSGNTALLAALGERVSLTTEARLAACGITVEKGSRIARIERQRFEEQGHSLSSTIVVLESGARLKADVFVWAGGVEAAPLYQKQFPLYIGRHGRLVVEPSLLVTGEDRIFAVGDGAYLTTDQYPHGLPMQASIAVAEGVYAARNIARAISGKPLLSFNCPHVPFVVPLGGKHAVGIMPGGNVVQGITAWFYKQWLELRYYVKLLGVIRGISAWVSMERICLRND